MSKIFDRLLKKKSLLKEKRKLYNDYDKNLLEKHKNDLDFFKVSIFDKFQNEYLTTDNDILNINYEMNTETLPGNTEVIIFHNNHGYRKISYEKYIIKRNVDIDDELKKAFPGIHADFSAKQIICRVLDDKNPIIKFHISRSDFKKVLDNVILKKEIKTHNMGYHVKYNYFLKNY